MADYGQTIFVMAFFTMIALSFVFSAYIYEEVRGPLINSTFATNESTSAYNKFSAAWPIFDNAALFILVAMIAGVLITVFVVPTHPIFMIGSLLIMGIEVFVSFILTNTYFAITNLDPTLQSIAQNTYPITTFIITHLPKFAIALAALTIIIMFSHGRRTMGLYG